MTVLSDALSLAKTYDVTGDIQSEDKIIHRDLARYEDQDYPASLLLGSEVQTITPGNRTGGTFNIVVTDVVSGQVITTASATHNFPAFAWTADFDFQADTDIPGYTAGDLSITGGPFGSGGSNLVVTFGGVLSGRDQPLITFTDLGSLTGGDTDPAVSETSKGQPGRFWFAALKLMGVIEGTDPAFGAAPSGQYTVNTRDQLANYPSARTIKALLREATVQEGQDWETELLPLLNL